MLCTEIVSDIQNNFCTSHVLPMFCKKKASDKDLPVFVCQFGAKVSLQHCWAMLPLILFPLCVPYLILAITQNLPAPKKIYRLADSRLKKKSLYQGGVKSTVFWVFEDLKFKISEG